MDIKKICIGCMHEKADGERVCRNCGFDISSYKPQQYELPPYTILRGKYMVGKVLGAGGFGITYLGFDLNLELRVAIKEYYVRNVMYRDRTTSTRVSVSAGSAAQEQVYRANRERFAREAKTLARLESLPGIVRVYNYFEENGTAYIVMEYLAGQTLKQYIASMGGKLSWDTTMSIMHPVMESLHQLHNQGIIHRDISPDNMMFSSGGTLKLVDFGGAKTDIQDANDQRSTVIMTKKGYSPVEQVISGKVQGAWTDEYAMAATFYYCLCGVIPTDSMERLTGVDIVPMKNHGADITPAQEHVIMKGLSIKAEDRYPSMKEFISALDMADASGKRMKSRQSEAGPQAGTSPGSVPSGGMTSNSAGSVSKARSYIERNNTGGTSGGRPSGPGRVTGTSSGNVSSGPGRVTGTSPGNVPSGPGRVTGTSGGYNRSGAAGTGQRSYVPTPPQPPKKKSHGGLVAVILILVAVIGFAGYKVISGQSSGGGLFSSGSKKDQPEELLVKSRRYDPSDNLMEETIYSYNKDGKRTESVTRDSNGKITSKADYEYWPNGNDKGYESKNTSSDGSTYEVARTYREDGTFESYHYKSSSGYESWEEYDEDGDELKETTVYSDGDQDITVYEKETDSNGRVTRLTGYDEDGEKKSERNYLYWNDGTVKEEEYVYYSEYSDSPDHRSWSYLYKYDEKGRETRSEDYDSDGNLESYTVYNNEYDKNDNILVWEYQAYEADGSKETEDWSYSRSEYEYNSKDYMIGYKSYNKPGEMEYYVKNEFKPRKEVLAGK